MKVLITPSSLHNPGTAQRLLAEIAAGPTLVNADGTILCQMTEQQRDLFVLRGAAHRLEVIAEVPEPEPEPQVEVPTMEQVLHAGYSAEAAERIIERQKKLAQEQKKRK